MRPYDAYIFDLDGTLYLGEALLPGARETVAALRALGRRIVFLSNNPTRTRAQYAARLAALGLAATEDEIVTSAMVMAAYLGRHRPGARVFVVGERPLKEELRAAGLKLSQRPGAIDVVVASFDRTFTYRKLQIAFDAIRAGATLVATNPDRYCPVPGGGQPDCAAITAAIEACTGVRAEVVAGKPSPVMIQTVLELLRLPPQRCIMTGDRLETDIAMGRAAEMATALVLTGATSRADLAGSALQPDYVLERLDELLVACEGVASAGLLEPSGR
ncbi:MAG: acid sugar phosphatase [Herpetosiphonaceae bacterium]|nr:MAG: acid sugar phosphatase [Herpetosiphonaceae bacterium]